MLERSSSHRLLDFASCFNCGPKYTQWNYWPVSLSRFLYDCGASVQTLTNKAIAAAYLQCLNCWNGFFVDHSMCYWNVLQLKYSVYSRQLTVLPETQFHKYYIKLNEKLSSIQNCCLFLKLLGCEYFLFPIWFTFFTTKAGKSWKIYIWIQNTKYLYSVFVTESCLLWW